jgi:hypothetical protein
MDPTAPLRMLPDRRDFASRETLLRRIRAEFDEMPCLRLTFGQAQRLFGLRQDVCERVLETLIAEGALTRAIDGRFGLPAELAWRSHISRMAGPPETGPQELVKAS